MLGPGRKQQRLGFPGQRHRAVDTLHLDRGVKHDRHDVPRRRREQRRSRHGCAPAGSRMTRRVRTRCIRRRSRRRGSVMISGASGTRSSGPTGEGSPPAAAPSHATTTGTSSANCQHRRLRSNCGTDVRSTTTTTVLSAATVMGVFSLARMSASMLDRRLSAAGLQLCGSSPYRMKTRSPAADSASVEALATGTDQAPPIGPERMAGGRFRSRPRNLRTIPTAAARRDPADCIQRAANSGAIGCTASVPAVSVSDGATGLVVRWNSAPSAGMPQPAPCLLADRRRPAGRPIAALLRAGWRARGRGRCRAG